LIGSAQVSLTNQGEAMLRTAPLTLVVALALPSLQPLHAQAGPRLRVWAPHATIGTLIRSDSDVLVIARGVGDTVTVARSAVQRADVSAGLHRRTVEGLAIGAFAGGLLGGLYGSVAYEDPCKSQGSNYCFDFVGPDLVIFAGAIIGGLTGGAFGALIGSQSRLEKWSPAPRFENPRLTVAPGAVGVRFSIGW
jgi:hypothetical protein